MDTLPPESLEGQLRWRYACKKFDREKKIPPDVWRALEQSLVLTPSSFGLQPWKFVVVTDPATKEQLLPISWGQSQVSDASHIVVLAIRKSISAEDVERYVRRIAEVRGVPVESLAGYRKVMLGFVQRPPEGVDLDEWAARQVYIALGTFMTAAAVIGVDTCPLEGILPEKYDELLELKESGYATVVACAAGYRSPDDRHALLPKVRFPTEEMVLRK
jgi:nitroreductase